MANEVHKTMTTDAGRPDGDNQNSLTAGSRGPIVYTGLPFFARKRTPIVRFGVVAPTMPQ
jgi:catalase